MDKTHIPSRRGFTLLEVVIATGIFSAVLVIAIGALGQAIAGQQTLSAKSTGRSGARNVMSQLTDDISGANGSQALVRLGGTFAAILPNTATSFVFDTNPPVCPLGANSSQLDPSCTTPATAPLMIYHSTAGSDGLELLTEHRYYVKMVAAGNGFDKHNALFLQTRQYKQSNTPTQTIANSSVAKDILIDIPGSPYFDVVVRANASQVETQLSSDNITVSSFALTGAPVSCVRDESGLTATELAKLEAGSGSTDIHRFIYYFWPPDNPTSATVTPQARWVELREGGFIWRSFSNNTISNTSSFAPGNGIKLDNNDDKRLVGRCYATHTMTPLKPTVHIALTTEPTKRIASDGAIEQVPERLRQVTHLEADAAPLQINREAP